MFVTDLCPSLVAARTKQDESSYSTLPRCTDVAVASNDTVVLACTFDGIDGRFGDSDFGAVMLVSISCVLAHHPPIRTPFGLAVPRRHPSLTCTAANSTMYVRTLLVVRSSSLGGLLGTLLALVE